MLKDKELIKLGIVGLSDGNGHPYSWSAIFNGYDKEAMADCPFPVIPKYLSEQTFPEDAISDAQVTHIWTQDFMVSQHVAAASKVPNVCEHLEDMVGKVDAVLMARDDAENHLEMSRPFLNAGLPVFIDKPLALSRGMAEEILSLEQYENQIFSCTALRFASEFELSSEIMEEVGVIQSVKATTPKSWEKYAVHIIEPVFKMLDRTGEPVSIQVNKKEDQVYMHLVWADGIETEFSTLGKAQVPLKISIFGSKGRKDMIFKDAFSAFRSSLQTFIDIGKDEAPNIPREQTLSIIDIIEKGMA